MGSCGCGHGAGVGPYAEGKDLVDFVYRAHSGELRDQLLPVSLAATCQGCGAPFTLATFVGICSACGGIHAVSPPRCQDAANIQFAGVGYQLASI